MKSEKLKEVAIAAAEVARTSSRRLGKRLELLMEDAVEKAARSALKQVKRQRVNRGLKTSRDLLVGAVKAGAIAGATAAVSLLAKRLVESRFRAAAKA